MGQVQTKPLRKAPVAMQISQLCVELSKHHFCGVVQLTANMDGITEYLKDGVQCDKCVPT